MDQERILVVDDDEGLLHLLKMRLSAMGFIVTPCTTGQDALNAAKQQTFDMAITDLRLRGEDGLEVTEELLRTQPGLPVIILTGHGDIATAVSEMKRGAFDFFTKPVNRETLLPRVREAVNDHLRRHATEHEAATIRMRLATLSKRECEVMDHVALGKSNKQIARVLNLAERTVANHRASVLLKTEAANSADLVRQLGIVGRVQSNSSG